MTRTELLPIAQEILALAMNTPKEIADIFVEWCPHVGYLTVRVHPGGWEPDTRALYMVDFKDHAEGILCDELRNLKEYVAAIPVRLDYLKDKQRRETLSALTKQAEALGATVVVK